MIDGQHPIQIGVFPMDIKCHTPQQLRQLQHHQHQHQQHQHQLQQTAIPTPTTTPTPTPALAPTPTPIPQHQQTSLLMNGSAGMLTTSNAATTATTIAALNGRNGKCGQTTSVQQQQQQHDQQQQPTTITVQRISATATAPPPLPSLPLPPPSLSSSSATSSPSSSSSASASASTTTPATILTDPLTSAINGSCSSNNNNNNNNNDKTIVSVNGDGLGLGPGPPTAQTKPPSTEQQQQTMLTRTTAAAAVGTTETAIANSTSNTSVSDCILLENCTGDLGCGPHCITTEENNDISPPPPAPPPSAAAAAAAIAPAALTMQQMQHQHQRLQMHLVNATAAAAAAYLSNHQHQQHHAPHQHHQHHQHQQQQQQQYPSASLSSLHSNDRNNANCNAISVNDVLSLQIRLPCGGATAGRMRGFENGTNNNNNCNVGIIQSQSALSQCGYCCQPICDRYIMRVVDTSFHEGCLKCATCSLHLVYSCFARDGKLYCRIDYERLFLRNRCLGCGHKISSDELVMRALENVFHLKCFACVVCGSVLKKGEQYVVKQGQLFCRFDYEKEVEMLQGYDFYGDDLFPPKLDGRRGPKRPRTILNTQQRRAFKASFEVSPKPCRKVRENLAKETGLSLRIVQVWFQNQRAKVKKIQKKAKQEHPTKGTSDSQDSQESDSSLAKVKDEAPSDTESLLESPYFTVCGGGNVSGNTSTASLTTGNSGSSAENIGKLRCLKDENENAPFNCMETDKENCNKNNEPILNTILGLSYATFQQLMGPFTQSPMVNPIDRLYSMQNSYFRPEELNFSDCGGKELAEN